MWGDFLPPTTMVMSGPRLLPMAMLRYVTAGVCVDIHDAIKARGMPSYVPPPITILVFKVHVTAWATLIFVSCATKGDMMTYLGLDCWWRLCLGPWPYLSQSFGWYSWNLITLKAMQICGALSHHVQPGRDLRVILQPGPYRSKWSAMPQVVWLHRGLGCSWWSCLGPWPYLSLGSVLMSVGPDTKGHADARGLGHYLGPQWCPRATLVVGVMQIGGVCVAICCHGDIQAWAVDEDYDYLPWIGSMLMSVAYSGSKGHMGLGHNLWPPWCLRAMSPPASHQSAATWSYGVICTRAATESHVWFHGPKLARICVDNCAPDKIKDNASARVLGCHLRPC